MMQPKSPRADVLGIAASGLCAVHCLATPIVLATLPVCIGEAWESPVVHQVFAIFIIACCLFACLPSYQKHKDWRVPAIMGIGLSIILLALLFPQITPKSWEIPLLSFGSLVLIIGNIINYRKIGSCCHSFSVVSVAKDTDNSRYLS